MAMDSLQQRAEPSVLVPSGGGLRVVVAGEEEKEQEESEVAQGSVVPWEEETYPRLPDQGLVQLSAPARVSALAQERVLRTCSLKPNHSKTRA